VERKDICTGEYPSSSKNCQKVKKKKEIQKVKCLKRMKRLKSFLFFGLRNQVAECKTDLTIINQQKINFNKKENTKHPNF